jgi:hypothetical protein
MTEPDPAEMTETGIALEGVTITNEFTAVHVRPVQTRNGERLELRSLRMPYSIRLDALLLEALCWQDPLKLGKLLEAPFGPEVDADPGRPS